jgi:hypothetical protein
MEDLKLKCIFNDQQSSKTVQFLLDFFAQKRALSALPKIVSKVSAI